MRTGRSQLANALAVLLLVGCVSAPALAKRGAAQGKAKHDRSEKPRIEAEKKQNRAKRAMAGMPPRWMERLREMSPEQQRHVREDLLPKWQQLPPERRQAILRRLSALRNLSESERVAKLNDSAFLQGLNPEDRGTLRELAGLRVGTPPEPPQENP